MNTSDGKQRPSALELQASCTSNMRPFSDEEWRASKRLRKKLDIMIMPLVILVFLLSYIDRANYASARLQGLEHDLALSDSDYLVALSIFYVGYILAQVPSNLALNYSSRPSIYLGTCVIAWGLVTTCTSQVQSYAGLVVCRLVLGLTEAPFVPGILFYLSKWYTRDELNFRMALFYSGSLLSGAVGNLIAAGILKGLAGKRHMSAWQWLYIIEGSITIFVGLVIITILPDFPHSWKRLSAEEKQIAMRRLALDVSEDDLDDQGLRSQLEGLKLAMKDPKTYITAAMHVCMIGTISSQNFFPTLTKTLGGSNFKTLLLAAPPYLFIALVSLVHSYLADRLRSRYWFYMYPIPITILGFILFMTVESFGPRYFSLFLVAFAFNMFGTFYSWVSSSIPRPPAKRAASLAFMNAIGNSSSIWTTFLYKSNTAPFYRLAFGTTIGLQCGAAILATILRYILIRENEKENEAVSSSAHGTAAAGSNDRVDFDSPKTLSTGKYLI